MHSLAPYAADPAQSLGRKFYESTKIRLIIEANIKEIEIELFTARVFGG